jgi:NAD(P)-dependent dehydrogenase (short-subunit alcohol dehydrogenase family)
MSEKTALVTGANGGLGTHVTKAFLEASFTVVGLAPRIQASDFDHPHFPALPATLDSLDAAKKAVETVIAHFGKIDVLVHTVGGFTGGQAGLT